MMLIIFLVSFFLGFFISQLVDNEKMIMLKHIKQRTLIRYKFNQDMSDLYNKYPDMFDE